MNRYRLNQILEVLLFPVCDPEQGRADILLKCYNRYHSFMQECDKVLSQRSVRQNKSEKFRRAQGELCEYLINKNHYRIKSQDDVQLLCEIFYPMPEIEKMMTRLEENCVKKGCKFNPRDGISLYYIRNLQRVSRSLITYRNGVTTIRQWVNEKEQDISGDIFGNPGVFNKIEIWNLLCRFTAPDFYIAIAAAEMGHGIEALYEQKSQIKLTDKLLEKSLQKGIAENHLHFHAGYDYEILWIRYMDLGYLENQKSTDPCSRLQMALFRYLSAVYLKGNRASANFQKWLMEEKERRDWEETQKGFGYLLGVVYDLYHGMEMRFYRDEVYEQALKLYLEYESAYGSVQRDYLMNGVYGEYTEYKTSSEFLFLYQSYVYIKENEQDCFYARLFLQYLRMKNQYFYQVCEQNMLSGIKFFQSKYKRARKAMQENVLESSESMLEVFRSQGQLENLTKLEIRVAPCVDADDFSRQDYSRARRNILPQLRDQLVVMLEAYRRYLLESVMGVAQTTQMLSRQETRKKEMENFLECAGRELAQRQLHVPTVGIVFSFLKREELENMSGSYCWRSMLDNPGTDTVAKLYLRGFMTNIAIALEELRYSIPGLSEYLVGIDAASDENAMEPWMLSGVYRSMRSHEYVHPVAKWHEETLKIEKIQNIGFTYHVGEDFRHILSGFRHVDEVLENFGYKAGDRLGHSLVLGTDVDEWLDMNEVVPMPLLEYMENLLWVWGLNVYEGLDLNLQLEILEAKILDVAQKIYPHAETLTVRMLYGAYRRKFDSGHMKVLEQVAEEKNENQYTFCRYAGRQSKAPCPDSSPRPGDDCYMDWTEEKLLSTNYCPVFEERSGRKELVSVRKKDAPLYKKLQEYLVNKVEQRGIYVEANPTSNSVIGDFSNMQKHPLFFINQKFQSGNHRIMATVNSDDPAVFNTNVENELAYMYYAAEAKGYPRSEVLEWIDQIRQYGMDASFISKEKKAEQILTEINTILSSLKKFTV